MAWFEELGRSGEASKKPKCYSYAIINYGATAFMQDAVKAQTEFQRGLDALLEAYKNEESVTYLSLVSMKAMMLVEQCQFTQTYMTMMDQIDSIAKECENAMQTIKTIVGNTKISGKHQSTLL